MARKRRQLPAALQGPMYWAIRVALAAVAAGELGSSLRTARAAARAYARLEPGRVRRTMDTLGVAFPGMPEGERRAHALEAYEHLFMLGVEMACTPRIVTPDTWASHVQLGDLSGAARMLVAQRPCVMITGHCGNWELLGYAMALLGFPMHALYRPLDLRAMDGWVRRTRERRGLRLVDKFGATRAIPGIMARGEAVAFIADQNAGDRGLFVPFFGRMASTYKAVGLTAIQHDAPIVCGQARRLVRARDARPGFGRAGVGEAGFDPSDLDATVGFAAYDGTDPLRYRIDVVDIIHPEEWKAQPDPLFYVTARYRRALEEMVRRAPEQNLWLHRYWKSRPRWEHQGKPLPAGVRAKLRALPWMTDGEMARIEEWTERDGRALAG